MTNTFTNAPTREGYKRLSENRYQAPDGRIISRKAARSEVARKHGFKSHYDLQKQAARAKQESKEHSAREIQRTVDIERQREREAAIEFYDQRYQEKLRNELARERGEPVQLSFFSETAPVYAPESPLTDEEKMFMRRFKERMNDPEERQNVSKQAWRRWRRYMIKVYGPNRREWGDY